MTGFSKSNSGASMLYVLAALIVTGFISGALIKMTSSDKTNTALYKTSASARVTAKSGMIAATSCLQLTKVPVGHPNHGTFQTDSTFIMDLLSHWIKQDVALPKYRFIPKPPTGYSAGDFIPLVPGAGANSPRYRVEILAFDPAERNILLRSEGIGKGGSRATVTSVYNLDGLGYATYSDWTDENAIHIEDDLNFEIRAPLTIDGACRFSKNVDFGGFARGSIFRGKFYAQDGGATDTMRFKGQYTFEDNCYFGTWPFWEATATGLTPPGGRIVIDGKSGFPMGDTLAELTIEHAPISTSVELGNTSYWLAKSRPLNSKAKMFHEFNNNIIRYNNSFNTNLTYGNNSTAYPQYDKSVCVASEISQVTTLDKSTMLDSLGFDRNPCEVEIDLDVIDGTKIVPLTGNAYTASSLETIRSSNDTWNDFTVLSVGNRIVTLGGATESIDGKYILIINPGGEIQPDGNDQMFSVSGADQGTAGSHFTIINNGGDIDNIGGWTQFRGLIYNKSGNMTIGGSMNTSPQNFYGSIYANGNSSDIEWHPLSSATNPGVMGNVTYDPSVYKELEAAGLVSKTGIDCDNPQTEDFTRLKMVADRIHTSLVSQSL